MPRFKLKSICATGGTLLVLGPLVADHSLFDCEPLPATCSATMPREQLHPVDDGPPSPPTHSGGSGSMSTTSASSGTPLYTGSGTLVAGPGTISGSGTVWSTGIAEGTSSATGVGLGTVALTGRGEGFVTGALDFGESPDRVHGEFAVGVKPSEELTGRTT